MHVLNEYSAAFESFRCLLSLRSAEDLARDIPGDALWVVDEEIWKLAGTGGAAATLKATAAGVTKTAGDRVIVIPSGEKHKSWDSVKLVIERGFDLGIARDSTIVGVGGGVVSDLTAFAASVYMRGTRLVLIPTTLLSMVDAAFGGKTGINFGGFKNMIGTFYPAHEVRVCTDFIETLPDREYRGGLAEVIKYAFLGEMDLRNILLHKKEQVLARDPEILADIVWKSLLMKAKIVEADLKENSIRAHLNWGHTFGHALEAVAGFSWSHGEAIAWGMVRAALLGEKLGMTPSSYRAEVRSVIESYGYKTQAPDAGIDALIRAMLMDKKKKSGAVRFVIQRDWGDTLQAPAGEDLVREVLSLP